MASAPETFSCAAVAGRHRRPAEIWTPVKGRRYDPAAVGVTTGWVDEGSEVSAVRVARIAIAVAVTVALAGVSAACSGPSTGTATPSPRATTGPSLSRVVLDSNGFGALKLGMTAAQAQATHLVGPASLAPGQTCPTGRLLAAPSGATPSLFFSPSLGLVAIYAYSGITTPAGMRCMS